MYRHIASYEDHCINKVYAYRNVRPKDRPRFCVIVRTLCAKNEEVFYKDQDEIHTNLGDTLTSSFNSYKDLQLTYCSNYNNVI